MPGTSPGPARRTWFQRAVIAGNLVAMVAFLGAAAVLGYTYSKYGQIPRVEIGEYLSDTDVATNPTGAQNFLLVGVDSADGLDIDDPVRATRARLGGLRSDTMMILRVDPASSRAAMLSIPRDLWVPVAGTRGSAKINSAVQIGGPEGLIETIQDYFGIPINHYVQVDFAGFRSLVEAIDGVPMYFPNPVRDHRSGLHVPEAGCVTLDAANALGFVRSRAYQEQIDGRWRTDGTGDLGRIRRQQEFINRALARAYEQGLRNPVTLDALIDAALGAVTVDDTLNGDDLIDLGASFRGFDPSELDMYDLPVADDSIGGAAVLRLQTRTAEPILDVFRNRDPSTISESEVRVLVLNGTGEPGQAADAASELRERGFSIAGTGDATRLGASRTEIRYPPGEETAADLLDRWLDADARRIRDADVDNVTLQTGDDFDGFLDEAEPPGSTTTTTLPRTTTTRGRSGSTATTSTTILGTVPIEFPDGVNCG